jgi:predicted metal-dependent hydrolase
MSISSISGLPPDVEVRRSTRRRRTVSAFRDGGRTVVVVPARMSERDIRTYVTDLLDQLAARDKRTRRTDQELHDRALALLLAYLPGGAEPATVRWVANQHERWGSCTTTDLSIRLSDRLQGMPDYVVDYVLLHELAHLQVAGHGADFERLLVAYPDVARARAFLDGVAFTRRSPSAAPESPVARRRSAAAGKPRGEEPPSLF